MTPLNFGPSVGQRWWAHHIWNTRTYLEAALTGDEVAALKALRELWAAVAAWQRVTRNWAAGVLIGGHTVLAKELIDGFSRKAGPEWAATIAEALGKNVEATRKLFPKNPERFTELFAVHTDLAGAYITDLVEGDVAAFEKHFQAAINNGLQLAAFTDREFGNHGRMLL